MKLRTAALAVTTLAAPATAVDVPAQRCERTFTAKMFDRAARATYRGAHLPRRGAYASLWREAKCQRPPSSERHARVLWHRQLVAWAARRQAAIAQRLAYGEWAIPAPIVMCESGGRNLPPNSAGASGFYQVIVSTWQAYGGSRYAPQAYLATKTGQDTIAGRIWREGGPSQWVCKG